MKDANIITLYKNKGDRGDCINYIRIALLSVVGKLLACVVLKRLQVLAESIQSIQNWSLSRITELIDPPLTWYFPSDSCR